MAKTKILITRHARTVWNKERKIQGQTDSPLLVESIGETFQFAHSIKHHKIKTIYTSTLPRSIKTGKIIQEVIKAEEIISIESLSERNYGKFEGKTWIEIKEEFDQIELDKEKIKEAGLESWKDFQKRTVNAIKKISKNHLNETILIVSHGGSIRSILEFLNKADNTTRVPNNSLFIFEFEDNTLTLIDSA